MTIGSILDILDVLESPDNVLFMFWYLMCDNARLLGANARRSGDSGLLDNQVPDCDTKCLDHCDNSYIFVLFLIFWTSSAGFYNQFINNNINILHRSTLLCN